MYKPLKGSIKMNNDLSKTKEKALIQFRPGDKIKITNVCSNRKMKNRLASLGIFTNAEIIIKTNIKWMPLILEVYRSNLILGRIELASKIYGVKV